MTDKSGVKSRTEPRFDTDAAATIETIRGHVKTWECRIINVSGKGFRLVSGEPLELGETIRLTVCGNQALAEVRYCVNAGDSFVVGVGRVYKWVAPGSVAPAEPVMSPQVRHPMDSLRAAATSERFADPHLRMKQAKSKVR